MLHEVKRVLGLRAQRPGAAVGLTLYRGARVASADVGTT